MGSVCYTVMVRLHSLNIHTLFHLHHPSQISLGEMIVYLPIPGGHITLAERFVDPAFSFAMGWNYWYGTCISRVSTQILDVTCQGLSNESTFVSRQVHHT